MGNRVSGDLSSGALAVSDGEAVPTQYRFTWKLTFKFEFWFLGLLLAKVGPRALLIGSGSTNGAKRTQNQPRGPIRMSCRASFVAPS